MDYAKIWFVLWAVLWTGYFALDGYDLGVGFSGWLAAEDEAQRREVFASIGPFWDGNEVWLVTAGGATFAAFPPVYAGLFSWLYPALLLILFSLIARGTALEFRGKAEAASWKTFWGRAAAVSSFLAALLFGVAFGNLFRGLEIGPAGYQGTFSGLLNPYALLTGLLFCAFFFFHGQLWIASRVAGAASGRAAALAARGWAALAALLAVFIAASCLLTGLAWNFTARPYLLALPLLLVLSLVSARALLARGRPDRAFSASFFAIACFSLTGFAGLYPDLLPSRLGQEFGLNVYNSSSSPYTLRLMTAVAAVFLPVIIAYQAWVYRIFRAPLANTELDKNGVY